MKPLEVKMPLAAPSAVAAVAVIAVSVSVVSVHPLDVRLIPFVLARVVSASSLVSV
jgi:hypothetical protein